jgi:protein SCO1
MTRRSAVIAVCAGALLAVLGGAGLRFAATKDRAPVQSTSRSAVIGGPFALIDTDGKTVTDRSYRGKWMLIDFGYTFCPDACPTALTNVSAALDRLGRDADAIQPLFITVDPKRDTVAAMADYLKSFSPRIVGLTGTQAQTDAAAKAYRVYVAPQKGEGDDYLIDHSAYFYLMDRDGKFVNVIAGSASGDDIAAKLRQLMAQAA